MCDFIERNHWAACIVVKPLTKNQYISGLNPVSGLDTYSGVVFHFEENFLFDYL